MTTGEAELIARLMARFAHRVCKTLIANSRHEYTEPEMRSIFEKALSDLEKGR